MNKKNYESIKLECFPFIREYKVVKSTLYYAFLAVILYLCQQNVDMTGFNSYIDGLDLSALNEYCVNHVWILQLHGT